MHRTGRAWQAGVVFGDTIAVAVSVDKVEIIEELHYDGWSLVAGHWSH